MDAERTDRWGPLAAAGMRTLLFAQEPYAEHAAVVRTWLARVESEPDETARTIEPPTQPGTLLLGVGIDVSDDLGTRYVPAALRAAGTGTEWDATVHLRPPVAAGAQTLSVAMTGRARTAAASFAL